MRSAWLVLALVACGGGIAAGPDGGSPDGGAPCGLAARDPCCFDDEDCPAGLGARCYEASCSASGEGMCEIPAPSGMCWTSADCPPGQSCAGASICPCGVACIIADKPGRCEAVPSKSRSSTAQYR